MINKEAIKWLTNLIEDIGKSEYGGLWHYEQALSEIKEMLEKEGWITCSKDLPEELIAVNVTWVNHDPPSYYRADKDKRFVDTAVYYQGDWYWWDVVLVDVLKEYGNSRVTCIDSEIEIIAWRPLPEPWEGSEDGI